MRNFGERFLHSSILAKSFWLGSAIIVMIALYHILFYPSWVQPYNRLDLALFGVLILVIWVSLYLLTKKILSILLEKKKLEEQLQIANDTITATQQEKDAFFLLSRKFVEASDEKELIEFVLQLSTDIVGASGASYVPLDERGQPVAVYSKGKLPFPVVTDWVEYLASPSIRARCKNCQLYGETATSCPLLTGPYSDAIGMFCLPLVRGSREYGILNLYLPSVKALEIGKKTFLKTMIDETALALDGIRLRRRELDELRQMQSLRQKADLNQILQTLLEHTGQMLQADLSCLVVYNKNELKSRADLYLGEEPPQVKLFVDGVIKGVMASGQPVILGEISIDPEGSNAMQSFLATPCNGEDLNVVGAILVGSRKKNAFSLRQLLLLQTVADQAIRIIENTDRFTNLEYQSIMVERTRLAREIHDGLAQTLGFLKLHIAQMKNYLSIKEYDRLQAGLNVCYSTISEAYTDTRQAIDGLRIWPHEMSINNWLFQVCKEFEDVSGLPVDIHISDVETPLAPEIQAQLIRIVQESLSNIRKHSRANNVKVSLIEQESQLCLEIHDNGIGFSPDDVSIHTQHGLQGMRERSDLIGAEYQIVSREGIGTSIQLLLPLSGTTKGEITL